MLERPLAIFSNDDQANTELFDLAALPPIPSASRLFLSPHGGAPVRIQTCALVGEDNQLRISTGASALGAEFGPRLEAGETAFAGDVGIIRSALQVDGVVSTVMLLEAGPDGGVLDASLGDRRITIDLFRPLPQLVPLRLDACGAINLRELWDPLEIHVLGISNRQSNDTQCVISGLYTDYPRRRAANLFVERFKLPASYSEQGANGDIIVRRGTCLFSNPQRTAVEVVCHEWAGLVVLRRGPLLNAVDLYATLRCKGIFVSESCEIAVGRNTGLGVGEAPMFGAFLDIFNP
jgi:hypothetical protein